MTDWTMKGKAALVILHMQQGIVGKDSHIPGLYEAVKKSGIVPLQQTLLKSFRDKELPVMPAPRRRPRQRPRR